MDEGLSGLDPAARVDLRKQPGGEPQALTPAPGRDWRFADGVIDGRRNRWIGVREDHTVEGEPVNTIVAVGLDASAAEPGRVLLSGHDFYASPRPSPDGRRLLWLAWDHPNMPWNGTTLYLAEVAEFQSSVKAACLAGRMDYAVMDTSRSPAILLAAYLAMRTRTR